MYPIFWRSRPDHQRKIPGVYVNTQGGLLFVDIIEKNFVSCSKYVGMVSLGKLGWIIIPFKLFSFSCRFFKTVKALKKSDLAIIVDPFQALTLGLYTWIGCLGMAKLTRKTQVVSWEGDEEEISKELRVELYEELIRYSGIEIMARNNYWVEFGISLARLLSKERGDVIVDDWIPKDSPYWENVQGEE